MSDHSYRVVCDHTNNTAKSLAVGELHVDVHFSVDLTALNAALIKSLDNLKAQVRDLVEERDFDRNEAARAHDRADAAEKQCKQLIADMFKEAGGITGEVPLDLITADVLASAIRSLRQARGTRVERLPPRELAKRAEGAMREEFAKREKELAEWVTSLYPEAVAQYVFDQLEEPPGTWVWHKDRLDDWNKRAEARWEELVADYQAALKQGLYG